MANLLGVLIFAAVLARLDVVEPQTQRALSAVAAESLAPGVPTILLHAFYAGWLIALMVWMLPGAENAKALTIIVLTYLIGLGGFAHVIAGSTDALYAAIRGETSLGHAVGGYILPTLVGNVVGGVSMVAALNHAQATSGE